MITRFVLKDAHVPAEVVETMERRIYQRMDAYFKDVKQELTNEGFEGVRSPEVGGDTKTEAESIASMISEGTKTIVEQNKN